MTEQKKWHQHVKEHCYRLAGSGVKVCVAPVRARYFLHYYRRRHHLVLDLLLGGVVLVLGVLISYLWVAPIFFAPVIKYEVLNLESVRSLSRAELRLRYENSSKKDLNNLQLAIHLPENFIIEKTEPASELSGQIALAKLGDMNARAQKEIVLRGRIIGRLQEDGTFKSEDVLLTADFDQQGKHKQELSKIAVVPTSTALDVNMRGLEAVVSDTPQFDLLVAYITNPTTYEYEVAGEWLLPKTIKPGSSIKFSKTIPATEARQFGLDGTALSIKGDQSQTITVEAGVQYNGQFYPQARSNFSLKVITSKVSLQIKLAEESVLLKPGDIVDFNIHYQNNETEMLENATIVTELPVDYFVLGAVSSANGNKTVDGQLTWGVDLPELKLIKPGQSGDFTFSAKLKKPIMPSADRDANFLPVKIGMSFSELTKSKDPLSIEASLSPVPLETVVQLEVVARYFAFGGEQLGRGPLPPRVGRDTSYWVFLKLTNTMNAVDKAVATLRLAPNVIWTGRVSSREPLEYNEDQRAVTWQLNKIGTKVGYSNPALEAAFEVVLNPVASQAGQVAPLVLDPVFTGRDVQTNQDLKILLPPLTSDLTSDGIAAGKGKVKL